MRYVFKQCFRYHFFAALMVYLAIPLFYRLKTLDLPMLYNIGECYLPLAALFLFVPLGGYEKKYGAADTVRMTRYFLPWFYLARLALLILTSAAMEFMLLFIVTGQSGALSFSAECAGLWLSSLALGLVSFFVAELFGSEKAGFTFGLLWFLSELTGGGRFTGIFTLCGYSAGRAEPKLYLICLCVGTVLLISVTVFLRDRRIN